MAILNHWGLRRKSGEYFHGDFRPYFRKKRTAYPNRKKGYFFHLQGKRVYFLFSRGTFYAILILMYETPKVEPGLGLPLATMRINLLILQ